MNLRGNFPSVPPFALDQPIPLDRAEYDLSALSTQELITIHCVNCKREAKYGNTIEGVMRIYFHSHWAIVNRNALIGTASNVDALCEDCLRRTVDAMKETEKIP